MQLNRATDIALRVLMMVAVATRLVTIDELANALNVPRNHVAKVVQRLQRHGWVATTRGRGGGIRLPDEVRQVTVGRVVREFEGSAEVVDCDTPPCPLRAGCRLRGALRVAREAFYASLDDVVLQDLIRPPTDVTLLSLTEE